MGGNWGRDLGQKWERVCVCVGGGGPSYKESKTNHKREKSKVVNATEMCNRFNTLTVDTDSKEPKKAHTVLTIGSC